MGDSGNIRNIDQIQEDDDERRMPRGVTVTFVVLGGACIVFAGLAFGGRASQPQAPKADPLGELVSQRAHSAASPSGVREPTDLSPKEVTFPKMLSDDAKPATALAAVRQAGMAPQ